MRPKRDPHDISTWGQECGRGMPYKNQGTQIAGKPARLTISAGRKHRGMASDSIARKDRQP